MKRKENRCACSTDLKKEVREIVDKVEGYSKADHVKKGREVHAAFNTKKRAKPEAKPATGKTTVKPAANKTVAKPAAKNTTVKTAARKAATRHAAKKTMAKQDGRVTLEEELTVVYFA